MSLCGHQLLCCLSGSSFDILLPLQLLTQNLSLCCFILIVLFGPVVFFSWPTPYLLVLICLFFYICILCIPSPPSCLLLPYPLPLSVAFSFLFLSISPVLPPSCTAFYSAAPLTSAGIIPIMQSLCPDGQRDEFGFLQYKNSTWVDFVSNYLSVFVLGAVFFVLSELFLCLLFNFCESTDITLRLCSNFGSVWKNTTLSFILNGGSLPSQLLDQHRGLRQKNARSCTNAK